MNTRNKNGFTIIEVMIVVAIAGVIMLAVFLAIGQLQRNSRDSARRRYAASIPQYYLDYYRYNMSYPSTDAQRQTFLDKYLPSQVDPLSGDPYDIDFGDGKTASTSGVPPVGSIYIMQYHWCNDADSSDGTSNPVTGDRKSLDQIVVWYGTEAGRYGCVDNH